MASPINQAPMNKLTQAEYNSLVTLFNQDVKPEHQIKGPSFAHANEVINTSITFGDTFKSSSKVITFAKYFFYVLSCMLVVPGIAWTCLKITSKNAQNHARDALKNPVILTKALKTIKNNQLDHIGKEKLSNAFKKFKASIDIIIKGNVNNVNKLNFKHFLLIGATHLQAHPDHNLTGAHCIIAQYSKGKFNEFLDKQIKNAEDLKTQKMKAKYDTSKNLYAKTQKHIEHIHSVKTKLAFTKTEAMLKNLSSPKESATTFIESGKEAIEITKQFNDNIKKQLDSLKNLEKNITANKTKLQNKIKASILNTPSYKDLIFAQKLNKNEIILNKKYINDLTSIQNKLNKDTQRITNLLALETQISNWAEKIDTENKKKVKGKINQAIADFKSCVISNMRYHNGYHHKYYYMQPSSYHKILIGTGATRTPQTGATRTPQ